MKTLKLFIISATIIITGCATYNQTTQGFQTLFFSGNFSEADKKLTSNPKAETSINKLLYYFNRGTTLFMLGELEESNIYFEKADKYIEYYNNQMQYEALALVTNSMVKPYKAESFEGVMIHFYKALNYLNLKDYENAIVECRRVDLKLKSLAEKFKTEGKSYKRDAFAHNLMGIIYEAAGNPNDAFIAYRNAVQIYEEDYQPLFNTPIPQQLKKDIIRVANRMGFYDEEEFYKRKFGIQYNPRTDLSTGSLVTFWLNGQGPIKAEWSVILTNIGCHAGFITFSNEELGFTIPLYIGNYSSTQQDELKNLSFLKISFPKYVERPLYFTQASYTINDTVSGNLETAENINKIAFQSLKDRMIREISNSIARVAIKKSMEMAGRNQNEYVGMAISLTNMITERADTRNWQTLPYSINYSRSMLSPGSHTINFTSSGNENQTVTREFDIKQGQTTFLTFTNLQANYTPPAN